MPTNSDPKATMTPEGQVGRDRRAQQASAGIWLNKRTVALINIPFEHTLAVLQDGWRLEAMSTGLLTVRLADGKEHRFNLSVGDHLSTTGEEMYLYIAPKADAKGG